MGGESDFKTHINKVGNLESSLLDVETSVVFGSILKNNILGKDKQEKVNSIVILAKLLDVIESSDSISDELGKILDHELMETLLAVTSFNMSIETYKAILRTCLIMASGTLFRFVNETIEDYLPLFDSLTERIDNIDIITDKLQLQDSKINFYTVNFVTDLIETALNFDYDGIIPIAERLKRVDFFRMVDLKISPDDELMTDLVVRLKVAYYRLNQFLQVTRFDLSIQYHQGMLDDLFILLDASLNEDGISATRQEYIEAGFTGNPTEYVKNNFSLLSAMELCLVLKNPIHLFKKRFHQELMLDDKKTFPLSTFIVKVVEMWINIFEDIEQYPNIHSLILKWERMIYYSMTSCLKYWQGTRCQLEDADDADKIVELIKPNIEKLEYKKTESVEECLVSASGLIDNLRGIQVQKLKRLHQQKWNNKLSQFSEHLSKEAMDFLCEQRVTQLLKGSWVYTEKYGDILLNHEKPNLSHKYYFILLSPNRAEVYYKKFSEKPTVNPSFEQMESRSIKLVDIANFQCTKLDERLNNQEKNNINTVSVRGTISYEKITFVGTDDTKLLSFVTDTDVDKYVWLDGLKMLKGMVSKGDLSAETEKQLTSLIDIRKTTQLLSLEDKEVENYITDHLDNSDDDDTYDLNELSEVTKDSYFYK